MRDLIPFDRVQNWHALGAWEYLDESPPTPELGLLRIMLLDAFGPYWLKGLLKSPALLLWTRNTIDIYNYTHHNHTVVPHRTSSASMLILIYELDFLAALLHKLSTLLFDDELLWWASNLQDKEDSLTMVLNLCILSLKTLDLAREILTTTELKNKSQTIQHIDQRLVDFASRIVACAPRLLEDDGLVRIPQAIQNTAQSAMWKMKDVSQQMMDFGVKPQWKGRCYGPSCLKTAQEMGHRLPVCSHCKTVAYCSRRCQRNGWRYLDAPHREVCNSALWIRQKQEENQEPLQMLHEFSRLNTSDGHAKAIRYLQVLHESQFKQLREPHPFKFFTVVLIYNANAEKEVNEYEMDVSRPIVPRSGFYDDSEDDA
jgi:hypothetical protein